jgi:YHS domain-containing protein
MYDDKIIFDPVCGMQIGFRRMDDLKLIAKYKNESYHFCSVFCKETFNANPDFFIKQINSQYSEDVNENDNSGQK